MLSFVEWEGVLGYPIRGRRYADGHLELGLARLIEVLTPQDHPFHARIGLDTEHLRCGKMLALVTMANPNWARPLRDQRPTELGNLPARHPAPVKTI